MVRARIHLLAMAAALPAAGLLAAAQSDEDDVVASFEDEAIDATWADALARSVDAVIAEPLGARHEGWDDPWITKSEFYEVRTTVSRAYGLRLAQSMDRMVPLYQDLLGTDFVPARPFLALIHPTITEYNTFGDDHSDERSSIYGGFYADASPGQAVATIYDPNRTLQLFFLTHGAAQQFVARAFPGRELPAVLMQGLGAYFQASWDYRYIVSRFEALRDETNGVGLFPLAQLVASPLSAYTDGRAGDRFVQLAMTFIYLRRVKEETRSTFDAKDLIRTVGPFDDYIRRAVRREDVSDHEISRLLTEGADALDEEIRAFRGW